MILEDKVASDFSKRFTYVSDRNQYKTREAWYIMSSKDGKYKGDCEDYALTLLYLITNRSYLKFWYLLVTKRAKIQFCTIYGTGHAVLIYKGRYIDNIQKKFVTKQHMIDADYQFETVSYPATTVAIKLGLGLAISVFKDLYSV